MEVATENLPLEKRTNQQTNTIFSLTAEKRTTILPSAPRGKSLITPWQIPPGMFCVAPADAH